MERLKKSGKVIPKKSSEIKNSKIGLGFEKLDRDAFDPEKAYDKVAEIGVKKARIQSGWQKTEKQKGVYDFAWLDSIVDNFLKRGISPWLCLCYGNSLYTEKAKEYFGAVGCPPIFSEEEKQAWRNYAFETVKHYKGKISYYEIWNEPDAMYSWRHGTSGTEYGLFALDTAKAIKAADPSAKIICGALAGLQIPFLNEMLKTGVGDYVDYISFHEYPTDETQMFSKAEACRALFKKYAPHLELIQGESGSQSKFSDSGALWGGAWTQEKQAKQLARHTIADLLINVHFMSYFSCLDMVEALSTKQGVTADDYAYFGVLGADFDENGKSCGTYTPKKSYYVLQNIASVFAEDFEVTSFPVIVKPRESRRVFGSDVTAQEVRIGGFKKDGGEIFAYWTPTDIMTTSFEGTISFEAYSEYDKISLVDIMDGSIYEIPDSIVTRDAFGVCTFKNLPVKDTPLLLVFGDFL
ncbi:MAG: beta-galactosidase [Clostridia bacterium]|nr:beta-galactosidase [Clostridia bacterium]